MEARDPFSISKGLRNSKTSRDRFAAFVTGLAERTAAIQDASAERGPAVLATFRHAEKGRMAAQKKMGEAAGMPASRTADGDFLGIDSTLCVCRASGYW